MENAETNTIPVPDTFVPPECWPEFGHIATPREFCAREPVPGDPPGIRWSIWPITFEEYISDKEPTTFTSSGHLARNRMVVWKRIHRTDTPKGWLRLSRRPWRLDGVCTLRKGEDYTAKWNKSARRDLREWKNKYEEKTHRIEEISLEEFSEAYKKSTVAQKTHGDFLSMLHHKQSLEICRTHSTIWGVRDLSSKKVVAGNVNYYSPTYKSSVREFPFMLPEAKGGHASVGLIDHWIQESLKRDVELLVATHFWQPGEPKSWKGFSSFKRQFGYTFTTYPPALWKFVPGKLF